MVVCGILLFLLIYAEAGSIGNVISPILGGVIGKIKYVIPIGFFVIGINIMKRREKYNLSSKLSLFFQEYSSISHMNQMHQY